MPSRFASCGAPIARGPFIEPDVRELRSTVEFNLDRNIAELRTNPVYRGPMNDQHRQSSLTERSYWDEIWQSANLPKLVDLSDRGLRNHVNILFHNYFAEVLRTAPVRTGALIEVGCAQSKWLPYFAQVHALAVTGLDYSELGCARARELLRKANCQGHIVQANLFDPPDGLKAQFDFVLSMGVVEHFRNTADAICACAALAKPGGLIITLIPNLVGIVGLGQRWLDRVIYDKHVVLDRESLRMVHEACGLSVLRCGYLMSANFAVINHSNLKPKVINKLVRGFLVGATAGVWTLERIGFRIPATRVLAPYVECVAIKPHAS
jgi:2-polyprenyl-3-methyl-5-hydroxy-6-metoxy-1,4-benzoquinol methylase